MESPCVVLVIRIMQQVDEVTEAVLPLGSTCPLDHHFLFFFVLLVQKLGQQRTDHLWVIEDPAKDVGCVPVGLRDHVDGCLFDVGVSW